MTLCVCGLFVKPVSERKPGTPEPDRSLAEAMRQLEATLAEPSLLDMPNFWRLTAEGMVRCQRRLAREPEAK